MKQTVPLILSILICLPAWAYDPPEVIGFLGSREDDNRYGHDFVCIGDQNGDGFDDLLVSNNPTFRDEDPRNLIHVYHGAEEMEDDPVFTYTIDRELEGFGYALQYLGNIIPDAPPYIAVMSLVYSREIWDFLTAHISLYNCDEERDKEPEFILSRPYEQYNRMSKGRHTRPTDFNGDGIHDFISSEKVGLNSRLMVHYGGGEFDTIPDWSVIIPENSRNDRVLNHSGGYDINGDNYQDILVLSDRDRGFSWLSLFLGGDTPDTVAVLEVNEESYIEALGCKLRPNPGFSMLPDINGDGYADWAVNAVDTGHVGISEYVLLFYGGEEPDTEVDLQLDGPVNRMGGSGDITGGYFNDDEYGDIVVGFGGGYSGDGEIHIHFGSPWMSGEPDIDINPIRVYGDEFHALGGAVGAVGDYNGDGMDDFVARTARYGRLAILAGNHRWRVDAPGETIPIDFDLTFDAHPNPFNSQTELSFDIPFDGLVAVNVYDIAGRLVDTVIDKNLKRGKHSGTIDGSSLSSGVYFVNLTVETGSQQVSETVKLLHLP